MSSSMTEGAKTGARATPFLLAGLCFFLPFLSVCCGQQKVLTLNGVQVVTGWEGQKTDPITGQAKPRKYNGDIFALLAALCAALGLLCCLEGDPGSKFSSTLAGVGGFICLMIFKVRTDSEALKQGGGAFTIEYEKGFYLACLFFLVGAGVSVYQLIEAKSRDG
jgi:hypothetical protein